MATPETPEPPSDLTAAIRSARHVNIFTGAGMSADSGLDTFRDARTGIWSHVDPQAMASIDAWNRDPEPMLAWYLWRATLCTRAQPHRGHEVIGEWGRRGGVEVTVTTQNIDDLHERGGATDVAHLHGSLFAFRCSRCGAPADTPPLPEVQVERIAPPACSECGAAVRPGVVWFGEALPEQEWARAERWMRTADLVVIVGTSGVVWPAAGLPQIAAAREVPIVEISPAETELTPLATWSLRTTAAEGLPALVRALDCPS